MKLIADAGGTKTEWAVIAPDGQIRRIESAGVNALMFTDDELRKEFAPLSGFGPFSRVHYYGAGCVDRGVCAKVAAALPQAPHVEVCSDLVGAARALYGHASGLAAIIGTGSNTGLYDGRQITLNMPPLGYALGDEGSGAAMGRELLRQVYRHGFMRREFEAETGLTYADVLDGVYRRPGANRFLASTVRFIAAHKEECDGIVSRVFGQLMQEIATFYGHPRQMRAVGGLAAAFEPQLRKAGSLCGIDITLTISRPMDALIDYHQNS